MATHAASFPFPAITGMEQARRALLLLAVDPGLKGVLVASAAGTAKSLLIRAFPSLLPNAPCVAIPPGITDDRLLGGLDLERTLRSGTRRILPGLLARAHDGFITVDDLNLLDRRQAVRIASALSAAIVRLEREGLSSSFAAEFFLIGAYDPAGGLAAPQLADAVGLHVCADGALSVAQRQEILRRAEAFDRDPAAFAREYEPEAEILRRRIAQGRRRLAAIELTPDEKRRLVEAALRLGVEGNRADIFAARAARAHAALMGRAFVEEDDLQAAIGLVLLPRAADVEGARPAGRAPSSSNRAQRPAETSQEAVIRPLDVDIPDGILDSPTRPAARNNARFHGERRDERAVERAQAARGRCIRTVASRPRGMSIAVAATLRAAAPFQISRRRSCAELPAIRVAPDDLRYKQFEQSSAVLIVFVVDASGSMAVNRIHQAKGAVTRLLAKAYLHRDRVALISFRERRAEVLLPPTRSVELAKRSLGDMPVGGATPLAAGLDAALAVARQARPAVRDTLLVLLSDGRANAPREPQANLWAEIEQACAALRAEHVASVVIDTTHKSVSRGDAGRVAGLLGGTLVYLPHANPDSMYRAVASAVESTRRCDN